MKRCILDTERTRKATHPFRSTGKLVWNHERHSIHCWKGQNQQTVTFPADFWHATSHVPIDRSSIHGIDTWLIARRSYCQPFPRSNLLVVSLCSRHSWVSPYQIRNPVHPPCSIHIQFHGLNFESSNLVQQPKQTVSETENKHKHFKDWQLFTTTTQNHLNELGGVWARRQGTCPLQAPCTPPSSMYYKHLGPSSVLAWLLPAQTQQGAAEHKHLQITAGEWKPVECEDRHRDMTAHGTASCHWAKLSLQHNLSGTILLDGAMAQCLCLATITSETSQKASHKTCQYKGDTYFPNM